MTVDGTDFCIEEQRLFNREWYSSHKFNGPAVRYEIGVCIQETRWIVWVNGPFKAGLPDRNIA